MKQKAALAGGAAALILALAALGAAGWLRLVAWETHTGYFGPAFSRDGRHVYAVVRETNGITWGFGWEHFTSPAHAYPLSDSIRLVRIDVASGAVQTLERWATTPVTRRAIAEYRGRIFNTLRASVRPEPSGEVRYAIEMAIPVVPLSEVHRLAGTWALDEGARRRGEWQRGGYGSMGLSDPVLAGSIEVFALPGPESFPCAVVLLDHRTLAPRALAQSAAYERRYPDGPPVAALLEVSRRKDIERVAELERAQADLVAKYRAAGESEIQALLKAQRTLEDKGYLPKSPRIVAHKLVRRDPEGGAPLPLFDIAEGEMASGIFPDIEKAIAEPGTEIDKTMGKYIVHDHYANSRPLNAHLAGGGREFLVRFRGETYRVEVRYAR